MGVSDITREETVSDKERYVPHVQAGRLRCRALVTCNIGPMPGYITCDRHVRLFTHLPDINRPFIQHLRFFDIVAVSRFQRNLFPYGWRVTNIPPIIDDWIFDLPPVAKDPNKYVSFSAAWKGLYEALVIWDQMRKPDQRLHVGSPYSHGPDLQRRVESSPGCVYEPMANSREMIEKMRDAAGVFRFVGTPETFGVTDLIAKILGCRIHALHGGGIGAAREALGMDCNVVDSREEFTRNWNTPPAHYEPEPARDLRARNVIPQWVKILDLE